MAYGILKCDNITFDNGGSDQNVTVSGLYRATTSGVTVSGTIAAGTVSGVTVIGSTTVSGATVTGTTANFTSGNFSNLISAAATMSGALIMANQQQVRFREAVGNGVNHIALQAPAIVSADQTITLPDETGTVVTTGDNGSVTSTMILNGTIVNANINASAAIADTKLATISTAGKVSGTAITSGAIDTSGNLLITNAGPTVRLTESDGTATHSQTMIARIEDQFLIQTRSSTSEFLSSDYLIPADASGATDHIWRIANTEKARLNSDGYFLVGTTTNMSPSTTTNAGCQLTGIGVFASRSANPCLQLQRTTSNGTIASFYRQTTLAGSISVTTTATAYNTSSDYRLKENVVPLDGAITRLNQLPVHRFNFIADPDTVVDGFIAHEAAAVVPECVTGEKDEEDENGDPVYQGIDQSKVVPLLTAALQEAIAMINALEARIAALEA
jgi:hypothetical protein